MYYLLLAVLYPVSLLPFWILYRISDLGYVVVFHLLGYRKEIVRDNLRHAFPLKSAEEIESILKKFYRSFCDQWIELVKMLSIRPAALKKRMTGNWGAFQQLVQEDRNIFFLGGHTFNWEWVGAVAPLYTTHKFGAIYLPLSSAPFERLIHKIRSRSGAIPISLDGLKAGMRKLQDSKYVLALIADQSPSVVEVAEWIPFMHREAPFFRGPEQMPRRAKAAILLVGLKKIKRGYYQVHFEILTRDASTMEMGSILKNYVAFLEQQLEAQPENYLWSHRRWKHKRKQ